MLLEFPFLLSLIISIIVICVLYYLEYKEYNYISNYFTPYFGIAFCVFTFLFIGLLVTRSFACEFIDCDTTLGDKVYISSLNNSSVLSGNFILGCGTIDEEEKYIVLRKLEDGALIRSYLDAKSTKIYLDEEKTPFYANEYHVIKTNSIWFRKGTKIASGLYQLHVPKKTVKETYTIN